MLNTGRIILKCYCMITKHPANVTAIQCSISKMSYPKLLPDNVTYILFSHNHSYIYINNSYTLGFEHENKIAKIPNIMTFLAMFIQARWLKCESVDTPTTSVLIALKSAMRSLKAMISVGHTNVLKQVYMCIYIYIKNAM